MGKKLRTLFIVITIALVGSGCSIKFAYNFLDLGLYWELEEYIKFSRDQRKIVKKELSDLVDWHRSDELPRYADQMEYLAEGLAGELTPEHLRSSVDALSDAWQRIVIKTLPAATDLIANLSDEQVDEFFAELKEEEEDDLEDLKRDTPETLLAERKEYMEEKLTEYFGKLTSAQLQLVDAWANEVQPLGELALVHARQWREKMQQAVAERDNKEQLQQSLTLLFANPDELWSPEYERIIKNNEQVALDLLFNMNATLSDKQRQRALRRLNGFIEDLRDLSS